MLLPSPPSHPQSDQSLIYLFPVFEPLLFMLVSLICLAFIELTLIQKESQLNRCSFTTKILLEFQFMFFIIYRYCSMIMSSLWYFEIAESLPILHFYFRSFLALVVNPPLSSTQVCRAGQVPILLFLSKYRLELLLFVR